MEKAILAVTAILAIATIGINLQNTGKLSYVQTYAEFTETPEFLCLMSKTERILWDLTKEKQDKLQELRQKYYGNKIKSIQTGFPARLWVNEIWQDSALMEHFLRIAGWEKKDLCLEAAKDCESELGVYEIATICRNYLNQNRAETPRCCTPEPPWPKVEDNQKPKKMLSKNQIKIKKEEQ